MRMPPWKERSEAMLMILPPPSSASMVRATACDRKKVGLEIDVHHVVPILLGEVDGIGAADDAGIVDQDVDRGRRPT